MYDSDMNTRRNVTVHAVVVMAAAVGLGIVRYLAGDSSTPHHTVGCAAFAAPFFTGGLVALLGERRGHPLFVASAGIGLWPISLVSIVMWPLLIPAAFLTWKGLQIAATRGPLDVPVSIAIVAGIWGTFAMLLFHQDPATWQTPDGTASSSDIITVAEALVTGAVLLGVVAAAFLAPANSRSDAALSTPPHGSPDP